MSYERISPDAIPDSLVDAIGIMHRALRSVGDLDKALANAMKPSDLDPRWRNDLQCVSFATTATMTSLSLMGMTVKDVLKEVAKNPPSERKPVREVRYGQEQATKGSRRLAIAEDVLRRLYPMCSKVEICSRAAYLTTGINMKMDAYFHLRRDHKATAPQGRVVVLE